MKKFAIKKSDLISQRLVFDSEEKANEELKKTKDSSGFLVVEVWEFMIWFRKHDEKDFIMFYSEKKDVEEAIEEAFKRLQPSFALDLVGVGVVGKYGDRIKNEKLNKLKLNYENIS
mgnify:CR=1 FL=1